mmetsp:Transcript_64751/g.177529  ORF Transcript_64751/g.177529 Transcript_64751/m.177529 type:complete len:374 (-) Transcript_64751:74-1195(-)
MPILAEALLASALWLARRVLQLERAVHDAEDLKRHADHGRDGGVAHAHRHRADALQSMVSRHEPDHEAFAHVAIVRDNHGPPIVAAALAVPRRLLAVEGLAEGRGEDHRVRAHERMGLDDRLDERVGKHREPHVRQQILAHVGRRRFLRVDPRGGRLEDDDLVLSVERVIGEQRAHRVGRDRAEAIRPDHSSHVAQHHALGGGGEAREAEVVRDVQRVRRVVGRQLLNHRALGRVLERGDLQTACRLEERLQEIGRRDPARGVVHEAEGVLEDISSHLFELDFGGAGLREGTRHEGGHVFRLGSKQHTMRLEGAAFALDLDVAKLAGQLHGCQAVAKPVRRGLGTSEAEARVRFRAGGTLRACSLAGRHWEAS